MTLSDLEGSILCGGSP